MIRAPRPRRAWRRMLAMLAALGLGAFAATGGRAAETLLPLAEEWIAEDPDRVFATALVTRHGAAAAVAEALGLGRHAAFHAFDVLLASGKGVDIAAWARHPDVQAIDLIDASQRPVVMYLLTELYRVQLYQRTGVFASGVLNLSMGVPRVLLDQGASGERAVRRALAMLTGPLRIPVIVSAGNDGPQPSFVNPYALAPGVIVVAATNEPGTRLWPQSSRFDRAMPPGVAMVAAWGEDTVGARAGCTPKSPEEAAAAERAGLRDRVGADREACYQVASGTSFAAANVTRLACLAHQAVALIALKANANTPPDRDVSLPVFIRTYIDSGFDRRHPHFENRLADGRTRYGALTVHVPSADRQRYWDLVVRNAIELDLRYDPATLARFLARAARPVPGQDAASVGAGHVSWPGMADMLRQLRYSGLVDLFSDAPAGRREAWKRQLAGLGDPPVLTDDEVRRIEDYCDGADLVLGFPLRGPAR